MSDTNIELREADALLEEAALVMYRHTGNAETWRMIEKIAAHMGDTDAARWIGGVHARMSGRETR